jgi:hypothetical protein
LTRELAQRQHVDVYRGVWGGSSKTEWRLQKRSWSFGEGSSTDNDTPGRCRNDIAQLGDSDMEHFLSSEDQSFQRFSDHETGLPAP